MVKPRRGDGPESARCPGPEQDSQLGTGLGVTTAGPLTGFGAVTVAQGATTGQGAHELTVRTGNTPAVIVTPTAAGGLPSGCGIAASADNTNITVTLSNAAVASTTFTYFIRVAPLQRAPTWAYSTAFRASWAMSGRGELQVGHFGPLPGMLSQ